MWWTAQDQRGPLPKNESLTHSKVSLIDVFPGAAASAELLDASVARLAPESIG